MKPHHKKKALIGIPVGLLIAGGAMFLLFRKLGPPWLSLSLFAAGIVIYIWGCLALARAKGYSTALVLTVVFGVLFPIVVLLALPDKNKHFERR